MSRKASLLTLPVEMLHRIFDELDGTILFLRVRNVCRPLRIAVESHRRYALDFISVSKPGFHRLLSLIRPECATALSLANKETTPGQIGLFLLLVDIGLFTRLRSIKLLAIQADDLCSFLRHASRCSLTCLIVRSRLNTFVERNMMQYLSSILVQPTLIRLELLSNDLCDQITESEWSVQFKLRCLRMVCDSGEPVPRMIALSPDLETLIVEEDSWSLSYHLHQLETWFSAPRSRLTYLTLLNLSLRMNEVRSVLSQTPSLLYLKIVTPSSDMTCGSRWEVLIKTKLPSLNKFEFYTSVSYFRSEKDTVEAMSTRMIAPFRTPFWTGEKRWLVICNFFPTREVLEMYTSPICTSHYSHVSDPKTKTICNFENGDQPSSMLDAVNELRVNPYEILVDEKVIKLTSSLIIICVSLVAETKTNNLHSNSFSLGSTVKRSTISTETFLNGDRSLPSDETFASLWQFLLIRSHRI